MSGRDDPDAIGGHQTRGRAAIVEFNGRTIARIAAFMNGKELARATGRWPPGPGD